MKKLDVHRVCREWRGGSHHIIWESDDKLTFLTKFSQFCRGGLEQSSYLDRRRRGNGIKEKGEQGKKAEGQN